MSIKTFHDLHCWQKGHELVLEIYKLTKNFPSDERFGLVAQVRRSSVSICANIAEGQKKSRNDFLRFLSIAEGSLEETKYHLLLSRDLGYLNLSEYGQTIKLAGDVGKILSGLIQSLK